jgi:hypothetical protein
MRSGIIGNACFYLIVFFFAVSLPWYLNKADVNDLTFPSRKTCPRQVNIKIHE